MHLLNFSIDLFIYFLLIELFIDFVRPYPRYKSKNTQKTSYYEFHILATKYFCIISSLSDVIHLNTRVALWQAGRYISCNFANLSGFL